MLAMISTFGLPSILFTITPDDSVNFRIRVMVSGVVGSDTPPSHLAEDKILKEFIVNCNTIQSHYPGLCAIDFENIIYITISDIIGWDKKKTKMFMIKVFLVT